MDERGKPKVTFFDDDGEDYFDAFYECPAIRRVNFLSGVIKIPNWACYAIDSLVEVNIANSVTTIEGGAFVSCDALTTVNYQGTETQWSSISITSSANQYLTNATKNYNQTSFWA